MDALCFIFMSQNRQCIPQALTMAVMVAVGECASRGITAATTTRVIRIAVEVVEL